jgi:hypothetical protein
LQLLLLFSSASCLGPSFKHNPFLWLLSYIPHQQQLFFESPSRYPINASTLFVVKTFLNSEKSLFRKSCSTFLKGLNFVFESCYIFFVFWVVIR